MSETEIRAFLKEEYPRVVAAIALVGGSRVAAEDAVQEALARAWERTERGESIETLAAWVTTVAMNLSRSRWRRAMAERRAWARLAAVRSDERPAEDVVDLERALRGLSRRQREVVVLRYYLGEDVAGMARILRVSEGTVKTTLHRARKALAEALNDREDDRVGA
ncbi:MAG TPA: sigma-70 family RNA polymerase sigma factor [Actinomycetota bacterium]